MTDGTTLAERYAAVKSLVPGSVKLIAVSKKRTVQEIQALYDLGHRAFGENYPQELRDKQPLLPDDIEWHFIGHLQSNKVKYLGAFTHLIHGVDSTKLLDALDKRANTEARSQDVLIQVHIGQEETKQGFSLEEAEGLLLDPQVCWPSLRMRGLMGMASNTEDRDQIRTEFTHLRNLFDRVRAVSKLDKDRFSELSMGMSGDLDLATGAGSTMVRIGTAIFGDRA